VLLSVHHGMGMVGVRKTQNQLTTFQVVDIAPGPTSVSIKALSTTRCAYLNRRIRPSWDIGSPFRSRYTSRSRLRHVAQERDRFWFRSRGKLSTDKIRLQVEQRSVVRIDHGIWLLSSHRTHKDSDVREIRQVWHAWQYLGRTIVS
jgi:hypothetical protein